MQVPMDQTFSGDDHVPAARHFLQLRPSAESAAAGIGERCFAFHIQPVVLFCVSALANETGRDREQCPQLVLHKQREYDPVEIEVAVIEGQAGIKCARLQIVAGNTCPRRSNHVGRRAFASCSIRYFQKTVCAL